MVSCFFQVQPEPKPDFIVTAAKTGIHTVIQQKTRTFNNLGKEFVHSEEKGGSSKVIQVRRTVTENEVLNCLLFCNGE